MAREDPWDEWRKRRGAGFFGDAFPREFEREFERMREEMERFLAGALKGGFQGGFPMGPPGAMPGNPTQGEPFVYGFSMRVGPDGKPQFNEFGNTRSAAPQQEGGVREPLTDVLEGDREVAVTVELPGVAKEDVNLHVSEDRVTIRVETGRKYYKEIQLPSPVVPKTTKATFKNGVLDLTIARAEPREDPGYKVDIS